MAWPYMTSLDNELPGVMYVECFGLSIDLFTLINLGHHVYSGRGLCSILPSMLINFDNYDNLHAIPGNFLVAICIYCLVMISIERSKTAQRSALEIQGKFSLRKNAVWDKIQFENFSWWSENFFFELNFVLDCICLGLNFVSDYILQLYFTCNLLIFFASKMSQWHLVFLRYICMVFIVN